MANASVSDVPVKFCGVDFTLRASLESMVQLERVTGESYAFTMARLTNDPVPRLTDVSEAFAAFALPHGKHIGATIRGLMSFGEQAKQLSEMRQHVVSAIAAALPKKTQEPEGGGNAPSDPQ